jgi:hypothetical protein
MDLNDPTTVALLAAEAFETAGRAYALYGGLLTAAYGDPRETRDADLAVVDVSVQRASEALAAAGLPTLVAFEDVTFGGLTVSRLMVVSQAPHTGLNTIDLVRPRSARYAALAVERAAGAPLRGRPIWVLTLEDFIIFKVLSTRERDLEDARAAIRRSRLVLDDDLLEREIGMLSQELPDVDVQGRWLATRESA